jgi:hypothetical protein
LIQHFADCGRHDLPQFFSIWFADGRFGANVYFSLKKSWRNVLGKWRSNPMKPFWRSCEPFSSDFPVAKAEPHDLYQPFSRAD